MNTGRYYGLIGSAKSICRWQRLAAHTTLSGVRQRGGSARVGDTSATKVSFLQLRTTQNVTFYKCFLKYI